MPLVIVVAAATADPARVGEAIGRGAVAIVVATAGQMWRRRPVAGFWIAYAFARIAMEVGARS